MPKKEILIFTSLIVAGFLDWLTTMVGIAFFGAKTLAPLEPGGGYARLKPMTAQDFARKYLEAEQKKYELGTSQIFFVLQAQTDRVNAESSLVRETVTYRRNLLNLLRRTGQLLDERGVVVE